MTVTLLRSDALHLPLADDSVDLVVTSPPYFGLRSYTDGGVHYAGQLGSEATPSEFLDALIAATAEMRRVLKPSGSIFVNLGDKYNSAAGGQNGIGHATTLDNHGRTRVTTDRDRALDRRGATVDRYPQKSLMLIPERYRIRCVDELGLIARAVLVWSKPNGLPESVTDRVRRSHEDWVHLTKAPRYYAAVDEIREQHANPNDHGRVVGSRYEIGSTASITGGVRALNPLGKLPGSVWTVPTQPLTVPAELGVDHFAAFPMEWPRRLIRGWSPPGICTACGEGRRPVADRTPMQWRESPTIAGRALDGASRRAVSGTMLTAAETRIVGYACACPEPTSPTRPAVVLDPFGGTGTTALVADTLGRHGISVDMSADYLRLARWRTTDPGQRAAALQVEKPAAVAPAQDDLLALLDAEPDAVEPAGDCPAVDDQGRPCGRWGLPTAHVDGMHGAGKRRWPVTA